MRAPVGAQRRADALGGEHFQQQGAGHTPVDDVHRAHALAHRLQRSQHSRPHAPLDHALMQQGLRLARRQDVGEAAAAIAHPRHVGHQDQLLRFQRARQAAGEQVGVDVICRPVRTHADGHDHGGKVARQQKVNEIGVDALDVADKSEVGRVVLLRRQGHRPRVDEATVLAVQPDRPAAMHIDEPGQLLVELVERHLDDGQRALVGHAQAPVPPALQAHLPHQLVDAPAAAVHDDGLHAHRAQQGNVAGEAGLECRVGHRIPAEADDEDLAVIGADIRQRFRQHAGFGIGGHGGSGADGNPPRAAQRNGRAAHAGRPEGVLIPAMFMLLS